MMHGPYLLARNIYWKMPPGFRRVLRVPARSTARLLRGMLGTRLSEAPFTQTEASPDLTWRQFQHNVLRHRNSYRGIFVQGVVIDWNVELYQRPQHMAAALARRGYLVIYQTVNWTKDRVRGFQQVMPNVWVTDLDVINSLSGCVISFYSTAHADPQALFKADRRKNLLVYEYIDHIDPKISGDSDNIRALKQQKDRAFSGGTDFIIASAKALFDEAVMAVGREKVLMVPNGVDTAHYRKNLSGVELPEDVTLFYRKYNKIVGYFGALAPWLWYDELNKLIEKRPDLGFVFIGPDYYGGLGRIRRAENVLCTGPVAYADLPAYAKHYGVCLIPFEPGEIAQTTSPLKLFEYFALEKPVVVTSAMSECVAFPEVFAGKDTTELSRQIDRAFAIKDDPGFKSRLAALADENDWDHRARTYEQVFESLGQAG